MSTLKGFKLTCPQFVGITQMAASMPVTATMAAMTDSTRADNALAHYLIQYVRVAVVREMEALQSPRSDLAPFTMATFCSLVQLERLPHLRMQSRFPALLAWARSTMEQVCQLNGFLPAWKHRWAPIHASRQMSVHGQQSVVTLLWKNSKVCPHIWSPALNNYALDFAQLPRGISTPPLK